MIRMLKDLFKPPKPKGQHSFKILNGGNPYVYNDRGRLMYFIEFHHYNLVQPLRHNLHYKGLPIQGLIYTQGLRLTLL